MLSNELLNKIAGIKCRSAWSKGVKAAAYDMVESYSDGNNCNITEPEQLLNGAKTAKDYSYGGCALIYDYDIAERFCAPWELKRCKGGFKQPNSAENWCDVQARGIYQALCLIAEIMGTHYFERFF